MVIKRFEIIEKLYLPKALLKMADGGDASPTSPPPPLYPPLILNGVQGFFYFSSSGLSSAEKTRVMRDRVSSPALKKKIKLCLCYYFRFFLNKTGMRTTAIIIFRKIDLDHTPTRKLHDSHVTRSYHSQTQNYVQHCHNSVRMNAYRMHSAYLRTILRAGRKSGCEAALNSQSCKFNISSPPLKRKCN